MRLTNSQTAPIFDITDIQDNTVSLNDYSGKLLMISFHRFSSCPFCNLRMHEVIKHYPEWQQRGLHIISFWQSPKESILQYAGQQNAPFPLIPDPDKKVYKLYGVEQSKMAMVRLFLKQPQLIYKALKKGFRGGAIHGESDIVPADFLISPDLKIWKAYYGNHIGDHIPFAEIDDFLTKHNH